MLSVAQRTISAARDGRILSGTRRRLAPFTDRERWRRRYLRRCRGVIRIGANDGQERHEYARHNLNILWIEPIPEVFDRLITNIQSLPRQTALQALMTDRDGDRHVLHVSSGDGQSPSILQPLRLEEIWAEAAFTHDIELVATSLPTLLRGHDLTKYDALVLDTQGAELAILRGATSILRQFRYIECEAAEFEVYKGYLRADDSRALLDEHGVRQIRQDTKKTTAAGEREFAMLFERTAARN